ncbi:MAG: DNA-processing protein DprA [Lachnospiraceae bacterium]|nr:DNA-processing protein DprA [Lachnospiraceae bacterium]
MEYRTACFFLSELTAFSVKKLRQLSEWAGGPEEVFTMAEDDLKGFPEPITEREAECFRSFRDEALLEERMKDMEALGITYTDESDPLYPKRLNILDDRPFGLFVKGKLPEESDRAVAVIGARRCSLYGRDAARFFAEQFALAGVNVISGMALGADGYAGEGALVRPGRSFAVLAGGPDYCYPRENVRLYGMLSESGGILSERPPSYLPTRYDFPLRNRLISALSDAVVIIEATEKSGTLITADYALMQGKEVFALPGRVTDRLSEGCLKLIQSGADLLASPADVLQFLGVSVKKDEKPKEKVRLDAMEEAVFSLFGPGEEAFDALLDRSLLPVSELSAALVRLEIKGAIRKGVFGGYEKTR